MEQERINQIIEAVLFANDKPMSIKQLHEIFDEEDEVHSDQVNHAIETISEKYSDHAIALTELASGYQFLVKDGFGQWVTKIWQEKPQRYSRALLETMAIIAYRQPVTRGDIENIRGVAVSSHLTKTLLEREWIRVVGHRDVPGKPALYATTKQFLDYFGLNSLDQLPPLSEVKQLGELDIEKVAADSELQHEIEMIAESVEHAHDSNSDVTNEEESDVNPQVAVDADVVVEHEPETVHENHD